MISLEQIRLLEAKIARAIDLIRVLKEENGTLRKGLDSAQKRMKELEGLVDGFKSDQKEIENVIIRTLKNLDELEEAAARRPEPVRHAPPPPPPSPAVPASGPQASSAPQPVSAPPAVAPEALRQTVEPASDAAGDKTAKGELDIF
jgi:hypothetical protein